MMRTALLLGLLTVGYTLLQRYCTTPPPPAQGSCNPRFKELEHIFRKNLESGLEQGSALAVYHKGKLVCDLWGGWADKTNDLPWSKDSLSRVFSSTKAVSAISIALLCDRGYCDYEKLVSDYWPEFAQNGKEDITLGMLLSHQAGLAALDEKITLEMITEDPDNVGRIIAAQKPNWPPGTAHGYHILTFGVIVDQLIRRIDPKQRSLQQFFREEIAKPYDIDFHIGLPHALQWRAVTFTEHPIQEVLFASMSHMPTLKFWSQFILFRNPLHIRAATNPVFEVYHLNHPHDQAVPQGSYNGFGTARDLARLFSLVASANHHEEKPLLSEQTVKLLTTPLTNGTDKILMGDINFGPGVYVDDIGHKGGKAFFHPGKGCQMAMGSVDLDMSWVYTTNYQSALTVPLVDPRIKPIYEALVKALEV